jgi:hypothetical protein
MILDYIQGRHKKMMAVFEVPMLPYRFEYQWKEWVFSALIWI